MQVRIKKLSEQAIIPAYQTKGAAGFDLHATERYTIVPGGVAMVSTGLSVELPEGYEMQVRPRSGIAYKNMVTVLNTPGTIDEDYRGEVKVILINHSHLTFSINPGDRIAQGVITRVERAEWNVVTELAETERGEGGFGSTNVNLN